MARKHYVFLVHGTWGYQGDAKEEPLAWYKTESSFATKLLDRLNAGATEPTEWELRSFPWKECGNEHELRRQAGLALAEQIKTLREDDPSARVSFVAHSHGGNVVLEALSEWIVKVYGDSAERYGRALEKLKAGRRDAKTDLCETAPEPEELRTLLEDELRPFEPLDRDLSNHLKAIPKQYRQSFGLKEFWETLDLSVFGSSYRVVHSISVWARTAADALVQDPAVHGLGRLAFLVTSFLPQR